MHIFLVQILLSFSTSVLYNLLLGGSFEMSDLSNPSSKIILLIQEQEQAPGSIYPSQCISVSICYLDSHINSPQSDYSLTNTVVYIPSPEQHIAVVCVFTSFHTQHSVFRFWDLFIHQNRCDGSCSKIWDIIFIAINIMGNSTHDNIFAA